MITMNNCLGGTLKDILDALEACKVDAYITETNLEQDFGGDTYFLTLRVAICGRINASPESSMKDMKDKFDAAMGLVK